MNLPRTPAKIGLSLITVGALGFVTLVRALRKVLDEMDDALAGI